MDPQSNQAGPSRKRKLDEYRNEFYEERGELLEKMRQAWKNGNLEFTDIIVVRGDVDMTKFCGSYKEFVWAVENLYANDGRDFNPAIKYPPSLLARFGKDYALNAQGIYYRYWRNREEDTPILYDRKIWTPSFSVNEEEVPGFQDRAARVERAVTHAKENGKWFKSEYSWEADAWSDVFGAFRDDACLTVDKHNYFAPIADTDDVLCKTTGKSTYITRTPDATFGLAMFTDRDAKLPVWAEELHADRLEQLLTHPKYGLFSDPRRDKTELAFPFMVYEAKGWSGDCREARRQACTAAAVYLDMIDELVRYPGPIGKPRPYQTKTSHQFQVFALTSFGAYWHILVGYKRPRSPKEHAGVEGMSRSVYVFHQVWSGYMARKEDAHRLLLLIDQIYVWAITEYRSMVVEHLRLWHQHCHDNFHLEWKSLYDRGKSVKIRRTINEAGDLALPDWVGYMSKPSRDKIQHCAKQTLREFIKVQGYDSGKARSDGNNNPSNCFICEATFSSWSGTLVHLKNTHNVQEYNAAQLRWSIEQDEIVESIRVRYRNGISHNGKLSSTDMTSMGDHVGDLDWENIVSYHRSKEVRSSELSTPWIRINTKENSHSEANEASEEHSLESVIFKENNIEDSGD